jgi:hypothetical protein
VVAIYFVPQSGNYYHGPNYQPNGVAPPSANSR